MQAFLGRVSDKTALVKTYGLDHWFVIKARARGYHEAVETPLLEFFTDPSHDEVSPPWVSMLRGTYINTEVRFAKDAPGKRVPCSLAIDAKGLAIECVLDGDIAASSQRLERWLTDHGYRDLEIEVSVFE